MCGVSTVFGARAQRVVGRQRLGVEDVERGAGDRAAPQGGEQRRLVDDRPARGVDEVAPPAASAPARPRPISPRVRSLSRRWIVTTSARASSSSLPDAAGAAARGAPRSRFWLQAHDVHVEGPGHAGHRRARDGRGPRTPSVRPASSVPIVVCQPPARTLASSAGMRRRQREDQRPGQLGGRAGQPVRCRRRRRRGRARRPGRSRRCPSPWSRAAAGRAAARSARPGTACARAWPPRRRRARAVGRARPRRPRGRRRP